MTYTRYTVVTAGDCDELARKVNDAMQSGWQPLGGVSSYVVQDRDGYGNTWLNSWFAQGMAL